MIIPLPRGHRAVLVLLSHLPFHSHPTSTSQKEETVPTHSQPSILLLQGVIASGTPNKGTDGFEIRWVTVAVTTSGPRGNLHSKWIYFSAHRSWFLEQDTSCDVRRFHDLDITICGDITAWRLRFLTRNLGQFKKRLRRHPSFGCFPITDENDQGPGDFWFVLFFPSFCDWFLGGL